MKCVEIEQNRGWYISKNQVSSNYQWVYGQLKAAGRKINSEHLRALEFMDFFVVIVLIDNYRTVSQIYENTPICTINQ